MNRICSFLFLLVILISVNASSQSLVPCKCEDEDSKKFGYCDSATAKIKLECKYDSAYKFVKGMARVMLNAKYGFINSLGKLIVPAEYEKVEDFSEGFAAVKKDNQYFFIDMTNKNVFGKTYYFMNPKTLAVLTKQQLKGEPLSKFSNGLAAVYDTNGKAGFINTKGVFVIPPKYSGGTSFGDGIAMVNEGMNQPVKAIDKTGNTLFELPAGWYPSEPFWGGAALIFKRTNNKYEYNVIDAKGKLVFDGSYYEINRINKTHFEIYKKYGLCGVAKSDGQIIINCDTTKLFGITKDTDPAGNYHAYLYDERTSNKLGKMILLNKDFKRISTNSYSHIMPYENGFYEPYQKQADGNLLYGLLSKEGKELLQCEYDMIRYNKTDKLIFVKNSDNKEGLYDFNLKPIFKEEFSNIGGWEPKSKFIELSKDGKIGLANKAGKMITSPDYSSISFMDYGVNSYYETAKDKKKGIIDITGKEIIPPQYDEIFSEFEEGCSFLSVEKDGKYGWIDKSGKVLLPIIYLEPVSCPGKDIAVPAKLAEEEYVYVNKTGKTVFGKKFQWASHFNDNGIAYAKEKGKYGFINISGAFIVPPTFDYTSQVSENEGEYKLVLYQVTQGDKTGFYSTAGKPIGSLQFETVMEEGYPLTYILSEGLIGVKQNGKWGYANTSGKMILPAIYEHAYPFSDDKAEVGLDGNTVVIDKAGKVQPEVAKETKATTSPSVKTDSPKATSFLPGDITPEFNKNVSYIFISADSKNNLYTIKNRDYKTYTAHKYDGANWSDISLGLSGWVSVYDFKSDAAGNLYLYGKPNSEEIHLYKYSSGKWDTIPVTILGGSIRYIYVNKKNELYIRGRFKNDQGPYYISKYLQNSWVPVGQTQNNKFLEKAFYEFGGNDMAEDESGNLYVDIFRYSKPESKSYIAIWNGKSWSLMDTSKYKMDATIPNMAVTKKGIVYFPGFFKNETGDYSLVKGNAKTGWEMMSTKAPGFDPGYFESVSLSDNDVIYAAGWMRKNNEYIVAKWTDDKGWESFASGNSYIGNIVTTPKCVYATVKSGGRVFLYTEGSVVKEGESPR